MVYAKPIANPAIFHEFTAIESIASTMRITNLTDLVLEIEALNPIGFRETYFTATFKPDAALEREILEIYISEVESIKDAQNVLPAITLQPITLSTISHFSKNGGNALGISESDGPLIRKSLPSISRYLSHTTSNRPLYILVLALLGHSNPSRRRSLHRPKQYRRERQGTGGLIHLSQLRVRWTKGVSRVRGSEQGAPD